MSKKGIWHIKYKPDVFKITNGECFICGKISICIDHGVAHHLTYKNFDGKSVYSFTGKQAVELGIVDWCCNKCHIELHERISIDGNSRILERCFACNKNFGDYHRAATINLTKPICRKCYKAYKKLKNMESTGQLTLF